ncbi:HECT E3 ubiquitin ligase, putative [Phytophthora infestans T30-4]|uniref:HECT-type E3 ubiquitin transferase n=1 Tax=Phytophthora infestans (strain T30-4) TaxID=403677 RepID=D0NIU2_PHYIT|nr:HECT E3 ubiquitin ligase, putative [Phytophthora infestans T30-4]EEY59426.1 HECT E3 ubiquitin ligase, putative [Phytophthora infestans T30-4]|eukprot:XP_002901036.1 HECT E3 ubiquitin ligase, putative [Phytophthora infestans T30-4]
MFDGSFKSSRKVSLSGRKKPTTGYSARLASISNSRGGRDDVLAGSKQELMLQNRLAREERQALKKRTAASTRIQAQYRRLRAAEHARSEVFIHLEQQLTQTVLSVDIQNKALPTPQLQLFLRQFLFTVKSNIAANRIRKVQDYLVFMLLVSCLKGESGSSFLAVDKDARWVYQVTRISELALQTLVQEQLKTSVANAAVAVNPYLLLLDTLTSVSKYPTPEAQTALSSVSYHLGVTTRYGVFDAMSACITQQTKESVLRVENNRLVQVSRQFATKILLCASAASSPITTYVTSTVAPSSKQLGLFWASQRAIVVGNVVELTSVCAFNAALVEVVPFVLSNLVTPSLVQWAFDVKHSRQDPMAPEEDYDMDEEADVPIVPPTYLITGFAVSDEEARRGAQALSDAEASVHAQWQKICHSNFSVRCLDALLHADVPLHSEENAVSRFCHLLTTVLLSTGRPYVLSVAARFANPPPALFALLSSMTVEQLAGTSNTSVVYNMWQWIRPRLESVAAPQLSGSLTNDSLVFTTSQMQVLIVFNVVYSHMLLGLDDEAFYDGQWPLRLTEVTAVVTFLKQFIYDTCWTVTSSSTLAVDGMDEQELVLFSAVVSSIKLFNQLYDRDCRRRFMPDDAWLWPSMPVVKEIVDLELMKEDGNHDAHAVYMLMNGKASSPYARAALILITIPQVLSFNDRVQLFQKLLEDGKEQLGHIRDEFSRAFQVRVKRDEIVDDSFDFFQEVCDTMSPAALKSRVKVTFVNEQGLEEAGIDGGGVFKEFMDSLTKSAFSPEYGFFLETEEHLLYPNPGARYIVDTRKEVLDRYRFLGRFAAFFLNKLLGKFNYIDDLHSLDPELYKSLMRLKHYDGNVEDLALTFSVSEMEFGQVVTRNLVPDGSNVPVTTDNRIRYIHLMANYKLNVLSSTESAAFLKGFRDLIPGTWIQMFAPAELQMLIGGSATNINIDDWERHTVYGGGYHPSQRVVQWFWDIVRQDFTPEDRAALLKFITSCSRQPLLGFSKLQPQICIHQVRVEDDDRLPSSATCMNLLKLPAYSNREAMRNKLLYAIRANAGFDLS